MRVETFFEMFDQLANASNAVPKMRELVLHLAVQGRLVSNCAENPVSAEQIASEKQRVLRELRLRSHPETTLPTESDFPFVLPRSWHAVSLGDLAFSCPTSYGEDPSPSLVKAGVVKVGNIDNQGGFKGQFSERGFPADEIESLLARRGDLMVVKSSGSAENVHSGKTALCTAEHDRKIVGSNFVLRLRFFGTAAIPEHIWRILTSRYSRAWVEQTVQTMTYPNLKWSDFARLPIPLPPLAEQKRIVAKVDELMALCDRLEAQQQERETRHAALARASLGRFADAPTPGNLDFLFHPSYTIAPADLRKTILVLAFAGKLVPQDPQEEPAAVLLEKARAEKARLIAEGIVKKEPWADDLRSATQLYELPGGWEWTHISDVVEKVTVGFVGSMKQHYRESGVPFLRSQNVRENRYEPEGLTFISEEFHRAIGKSTLRPGDVVVTRSGNVGVTCVIPDSVSEANCSDLVVVKRPIALIPAFLSYFINSIAGGQIDAKTVGIALTHLNTQSVAQLTVALPPLAEQRRIVARVDQLMALVDQLETQLAASEATGGKLMEAVVAELTAQD